MGEQDQLAVMVESGNRGEEVLDGGGEGKLRAVQQRALEWLVGGKSVAETGRLIGVGRTTMFRWLKTDVEFRAAYNRWQDEVQSSCQSRLMTMTDKAVDAIEKALEAGDARAGLILLRGMGLLKAKPAGPTEVEEICKRDELERRGREIAVKREERKLDMEELQAELGM